VIGAVSGAAIAASRKRSKTNPSKKRVKATSKQKSSAKKTRSAHERAPARISKSKR
jgi:hypothetical protein